MSKTIELTTEQLENYIACPNKFYIQNVSGIPPSPKHLVRKIAEKYKDQMFYALMDGKIPDANTILTNFAEECAKNKFAPLHKEVVRGSNQLLVLHNWLVSHRVLVADIGTPFEVTFPKSNVILKGKFEPIRMFNNKLEMLSVSFSSANPDQTLADMSLKYTIQAYAVHKLVKKYDLSCIRVLGIKSTHLTELLSYRTKDDFIRLENTVNNVACAIQNNIFYPRESFECSYCSVKAYCASILEYIKVT
jgi:hypothetical protein